MIFDINTIKSWFRKGLYPTESNFAGLIDSFIHKSEKISVNQVDGITELLNSKAEISQVNGHAGDNNNPHKVTALQLELNNVNNTSDADKPISTAAALELGKKIDVAVFDNIMKGEDLDKVLSRGNITSQSMIIGTGVGDYSAATLGQVKQEALSALNSALEALSLRVGGATEDVTLKQLRDDIDALQLIVDSDDFTLDTIAEIVEFIKGNKSVIDAVSTNKLDKATFDAWRNDVYAPFYAAFVLHSHTGVYEPADASLQSSKHSHSNKSVLDSITSAFVSTWNALVSFPGFASSGSASSGKAVEANDSRLNNARTPVTHNHTKSQISDFSHTHGSGDLPAYPTLSSLGAAAAGHNHAGTYEPADASLQSSKHSHSNKSVIDSITSAFVSTWNALVSFPGFATSGTSTSGKAVEANDSRLNNARTPVAHNHTKSQISDFSHTHGSGDLPAYPTLASLGAAAAGHNHAGVYEPADASLQSSKHNHSNKTVLDSITSAFVSTWNALVSFPGFATSGSASSGKAVEANDSRLSNARTPVSHNHSKSQISDFSHTHGSGDLPAYPTLVSLGAATANHNHFLHIKTLEIALNTGLIIDFTGVNYMYSEVTTGLGGAGVIFYFQGIPVGEIVYYLIHNISLLANSSLTIELSGGVAAVSNILTIPSGESMELSIFNLNGQLIITNSNTLISL